MRKVFIVNDNGYNFEEAREFGELMTITYGLQPVFKINKLAASIEGVLKFYTEDDYLVLSGPTIINMLCLIYLFGKYDKVSVLLHDARNNRYVPRWLTKDLFKGGEIDAACID